MCLCNHMPDWALTLSFKYYTPGNLVSGSRWLCTQNLYVNFRPWLMRHPNVNKRVSSPDLLTFRPISWTYFEKIGQCYFSTLEKQAANFYFNFTGGIPVFTFFSKAKWRYFQLFGLWTTYLTYQTRRTATFVYVEIHKMLNFPRIHSGDWNICAEYDLRGWLITPYVGIKPYGDKKASCQVSDYKAWLSLMGALAIIRICRFRPYQFQNIPFTYKQSNTMKGFANEISTACVNRVLTCHVCMYLKLSIKQNHIKFSLYCRKNRFVMYRLSCLRNG